MPEEPSMQGRPEPTNIVSGLPLTSEQVARIEAAGGRVLLDDAEARKDEARDAVANAEAWFGPGLSADVLKQAPRLRWLQTASVGIEYYMYPDLVSSHLKMTTIRQRHAPTAEHAIALMLAIARNLPRAVLQQSSETWDKGDSNQYATLEGRSLLVLGTGQIGAGIARRATALGMKVEGLSRGGDARPEFGRIHKSGDVLDAVQGADWIVNALPYTSETSGFVSAEVFTAMKDGVFLVNVGRGKTMDEGSLISCLKNGKVRAAGLDVFWEEPLPRDHELWHLNNVVITPHTAGVIPGETPLSLGLDSLLANLVLFRRDEPLIEPADMTLGY